MQGSKNHARADLPAFLSPVLICYGVEPPSFFLQEFQQRGYRWYRLEGNDPSRLETFLKALPVPESGKPPSAILCGTGVRLSRKILHLCVERQIVLLRAGSGLEFLPENWQREFPDLQILRTPEGNALQVAQWTLMLTILLLRGGLPLLVCPSSPPDETLWKTASRRAYQSGSSLQGWVAGIVGMGHVGRHVLSLFTRMGLTCLWYDPYLPEHAVPSEGFRMPSLETLLLHADILTFHVPLTRETRGMFGRKQIAWLKEYHRKVWVINTSRGEILDMDAILDGVEAGILLGVAVDTVPGEPNPSREGWWTRWWELVRKGFPLVMTPHVAGKSRESREWMFRYLLRKFFSSSFHSGSEG